MTSHSSQSKFINEGPLTVITAVVEIQPEDIEVVNPQVWTEYESVEFWGHSSQERSVYVDWDELLWNGEPIELTGASHDKFKDYVREVYG